MSAGRADVRFRSKTGWRLLRKWPGYEGKGESVADSPISSLTWRKTQFTLPVCHFSHATFQRLHMQKGLNLLINHQAYQLVLDMFSLGWYVWFSSDMALSDIFWFLSDGRNPSWIKGIHDGLNMNILKSLFQPKGCCLRNVKTHNYSKNVTSLLYFSPIFSLVRSILGRRCG